MSDVTVVLTAQERAGLRDECATSAMEAGDLDRYVTWGDRTAYLDLAARVGVIAEVLDAIGWSDDDGEEARECTLTPGVVDWLRSQRRKLAGFLADEDHDYDDKDDGYFVASRAALAGMDRAIAGVSA